MKRWVIIGAVIIVAIFIGLFAFPALLESEDFEVKAAENFNAIDENGVDFSKHYAYIY